MKKITRRKTKIVKIGDVKIGGENPIAVQSMTKTDTRNVKKTVSQIKKLAEIGCEIIRVAVPDMEAAKSLGEIKSATLMIASLSIKSEPKKASSASMFCGGILGIFLAMPKNLKNLTCPASA